MLDKENSDELQNKLLDFSSLLDQIDDLDDKQKQLYKEIYQNAVSDRTYAHSLLSSLILLCQNSTEHAIHGKTMASYIERMTRSNDQLMKLAEIITNLTEDKKELNKDDLFEKIKQQHSRQ